MHCERSLNQNSDSHDHHRLAVYRAQLSPLLHHGKVIITLIKLPACVQAVLLMLLLTAGKHSVGCMQTEFPQHSLEPEHRCAQTNWITLTVMHYQASHMPPNKLHRYQLRVEIKKDYTENEVRLPHCD